MALEKFYIDQKSSWPESEEQQISCIDYSKSRNEILLLTSDGVIYLYKLENPLKLNNKYPHIHYDPDISVINAVFSNSSNEKLLLFCDNFDIVEFSIDRSYIFHIFYQAFSEITLFKLNLRPDQINERTKVKNFSILDNQNILKIFNNSEDNKNSYPEISGVNSFIYTKGGTTMFILMKKGVDMKNKIRVLSFENQDKCKEIFSEYLIFNKNEEVMDIFSIGTKLLLTTNNYKKFYILDFLDFKKIEYEYELNDLNFNITNIFGIDTRENNEQLKILLINSNNSTEQIELIIDVKNKRKEEIKSNYNINKVFCFLRDEEKNKEKNLLVTINKENGGGITKFLL